MAYSYDQAALTQLALAIQQQEGYYAGSLAYRNNNPGNLMYAGQAGATGKDGSGFAVFPDYQTGFDALLRQIQLDAGRGDTFYSFTADYAPASDGNNPTAYAQFLASQMGVDPNSTLADALLNGNVVTGGGDPIYQWYGGEGDVQLTGQPSGFGMLGEGSGLFLAAIGLVALVMIARD